MNMYEFIMCEYYGKRSAENILVQEVKEFASIEEAIVYGDTLFLEQSGLNDGDLQWIVKHPKRTSYCVSCCHTDGDYDDPNEYELTIKKLPNKYMKSKNNKEYQFYVVEFCLSLTDINMQNKRIAGPYKTSADALKWCEILSSEHGKRFVVEESRILKLMK